MDDVEGERHEEGTPSEPAEDTWDHSWVLRRERELPAREKVPDPGASAHEGVSPGEEELARLVQQAREDPGSHPDWEAACLVGVADLLENLSKAREGWQSLDTRLAEARAELERTRERLSKVERSLADARERRAAAEKESERLKAAAEQHAADQEAAGRLRLELEQTRTRLRDAQHAETDYRAAVDRADSLQAELDELRWQLNESTRERDELMAERDAVARERRSLLTERDELARRLEEVARREEDNRKQLDEHAQVVEEHARAARQVRTLQEERDTLSRQHEQDLVAVCDLRVALNRAERERDDAVSQRDRKMKKILKKIHQVLDEVGAPRGDELSYGERIRRLADEGGARPAAGPRPPAPEPPAESEPPHVSLDETLDDPFDFGSDELKLD